MNKETEKIKQRLNSYRWLILWADRCLSEIDQLKNERAAVSDNLKAQIITGMPQGNATPNPTLSCVEKRERYDGLINQELSKMFSYREEREIIKSLVMQLPSVEREILEMRYIDGPNTWEEISEQMFKDKRWVIRLHDRALKRLTDI